MNNGVARVQDQLTDAFDPMIDAFEKDHLLQTFGSFCF
jgi:hypothetical protein